MSTHVDLPPAPDLGLLPDVPRPILSWSVTLTVPHDGEDGPLVPEDAPRGAGVISAWTATTAQFALTVKAPGLLEATVLGLAACGEWARARGAAVEVRPA